MEIAVWTLTVLLTLAGLVGTIMPLLPGTTLILIGMLVHKLLLPADLSWMTFAWITFFWVLSIVVDFVGVLIGTRLFGGTKWGMAGASGGAFVGMFISLPALLLGTMLGAAAAEKVIAKKTHGESLRAAIGAATGFLLSTVARAACAVVMVLIFALAVAA
ncbi:MAG TPA: DUF456 domain-containing protein [Opitutaceae bacterium]